MKPARSPRLSMPPNKYTCRFRRRSRFWALGGGIFASSPSTTASGCAETRSWQPLRPTARQETIVATAGTVNTGGIDPLREIAEVASSEALWLHVDGAYGGLAALAEPEKFQGLSLADSLSLDAHKWLYQAVDCGCLLYRDPQAARQTFSHTGDYIRPLSKDPAEAFAFFEESIELSRRFRALKLWISLQYHGRRAFRDAIARDLDHAQLLAKTVSSHPELELLAPVPLSAVCFRHRTKDNQAILGRVIERGRVYLSNATIRGQFALRACFVNHRTKKEDVLAIVSEVIAAAELDR